ncbi:uncharacterized protein ELE39_003505 [Cryptosporidium sp. chipmunk genotype I]|uniref:uncharacterized protein n=1 Tax=Cryptosporidium sp. chipmunk genotype I TaxID=1280935 RepID=UPI00351A95D3|nr:hypothetical protein ELE39_003505 [Cryptosporidium sp. chipmunk genotype I]
MRKGSFWQTTIRLAWNLTISSLIPLYQLSFRGVPLPLVHEAAARFKAKHTLKTCYFRAKSKNKAEDTFEGQGTTADKPLQEVNDVYQMPEMVQIPGMCSQEGADSIKKLAEKKRGYKEDNGQVEKESEQKQKPDTDTNDK